MSQPKNSKRSDPAQPDPLSGDIERFSTYRRRGAASHTLRSNSKALLPLHRLPFVGKTFGTGGDLSFWNVPLTGGYMGGCAAGEQLAAIFLKYMRDESARDPDNKPFHVLAWIALDMAGRSVATEAERNALRGQIVGFMGVIARWTVGAATHLGCRLDRLSPAEYLVKANKALNFDEAAFFASFPSDEEGGDR